MTCAAEREPSMTGFKGQAQDAWLTSIKVERSLRISLILALTIILYLIMFSSVQRLYGGFSATLNQVLPPHSLTR